MSKTSAELTSDLEVPGWVVRDRPQPTLTMKTTAGVAPVRPDWDSSVEVYVQRVGRTIHYFSGSPLVCAGCGVPLLLLPFTEDAQSVQFRHLHDAARKGCGVDRSWWDLIKGFLHV